MTPDLVPDADSACTSEKVARTEISRIIPDVFTFMEREDSKLFRMKERLVGQPGSDNLLPENLDASSEAGEFSPRKFCVIPEPCQPCDIRIRPQQNLNESFTENSHFEEILTRHDAQDCWWDHQSIASSSGQFAILENPLVNHFHPV
jgi:hypothetical protein